MYQSFSVLIRPLLCGFIILCSSIAASAQFRAGIQGSVTDTAGAVIPGATVTLTDNETNQTQQTVTSDDGFFRFTGLAPGTYTITFEQAAFKKNVIENVKVDAETVRGVDARLEVGGIAEVVTVEADNAPLQTEDANIRNTLSTVEIERLPQVGRDPYELARLTPGVFGSGARSSSGGSVGLPNTTGPGGSNNSIFQTENQVPISANGQRVSANNFQIDGVSVNSQTWGGAAVITPSQEAVAEVTITSSTYSAEDGRNSGANIKVVSKRGANDFHGSLFFKYNDPELNAFNKFPGSPGKVQTKQNQYGGSIGGHLPFLSFGEGGPTYINGKDKLFFFFAYEGLRNNSNSTYEGYTETPEFRNLILNARPNSIIAQVLQQPGIEPNLVTPLFRSCADAGFNAMQCQAVNGGLDLGSPTGMIGQYVRLSDEFYTGGGFDGIPDLLYGRFNSPTEFKGDQYFTRIDYNATDNDSIAFSLFMTPTTNVGSDTGSKGRRMSSITSERLNWSATGIYNKVISPTLFNEARISMTKWGFNEVESNPDINFGIPRIEVEGYPIGDRIRFGADRSANTPGIFDESSLNIRDTFNWVLGNHNLKIGADLGYDFNNNSLIGDARPIYSFVRFWNLANDTPIFEGISADPNTGGPAAAERKYKSANYAFFVQDDWKVKPNLTLNLGLRYEVFSPIKDNIGEQSNIIFGPNGLADSRVEVVDNLFKTDRNNFGPQIGFAWSPGFLETKGVIRGGFGIGYNRLPNAIFLNSRANPPLYARYGICCGTAVEDFGTPFAGGQILYSLGLSRSPDSYPVNSVLGQGIDPNTGAPLGAAVEIYGSPQDQENAQIFRYSLEGQYQLPLNLVATLGYQGSKTKNLIRIVNQNFIYEQTNPAFFAVYLPTPDVTAKYDALLATLERRFENGFQIQANYRFAKSLDNLSYEGPGFVTNQTYPVDNDSEYGPSDYDVRHNFNLFGLWDLPVFRDRNDWVGTLLGGWQINGIMTWHTGFPWTPVVGGPGIRSASGAEFGPFRPVEYYGGNGNDTSNSTFLDGNGNFTGSFIPGANCLTEGCSTIFRTTLNTNANGERTYLLNPPGIGRNVFRGPRYFSVDFSLGKRFRLPEGFRLSENSGLDLRANIFNAFNNLNLSNFGFASDSTRINNGENPNPSFGRATGGLAGRVIELQARFSF